jgi:carbon-monoxide dehydrogenase medium subunit
MLRQRVAETDPTIRQHCPLIMQALRHAGHPTIRNRGTVGGYGAFRSDRRVAVSLSQSTPKFSSRRRRITAGRRCGLLRGELTTALKAGELLVEIYIGCSATVPIRLPGGA